ncbi:hypothetical protein SDC9_203777 [bioreactor metagenome]|uniref:Uncharacterized protein n=1 Tax=bioreactor metagenome TaxID=1076179 RepID=A0A645IXN0_9ZZZZ
MTHTLAANLCPGHFNAAAFADLPFITNSLVLSAMTFPVLLGSENTFTEKTIAFGLKGTIIDRFRFFYFAMGPFSDFFR